MENLNIKISVEVGLSQDTKDFLQNVFSLAATKAAGIAATGKFSADTFAEGKVAEDTKSEKQQAEEKPAEKEQLSEQDCKTEKAAKPEKTAKTTGKVISTEDLRNLLSLKVNAHRKEIKQKLEELGAPSITKLDESKYLEMFNYLESL